jgi:hypothetical protein
MSVGLFASAVRGSRAGTRAWICAVLVSAAGLSASAIAAEGGAESAGPAASAGLHQAAPPEERIKAFIGAGVGSGSVRYKVNGNTVSFSDDFQGASDESPLIAVKVVSFGIAVKPNLYAGMDLTGLTQSGTVGTSKTDQLSNYFASLTWFPWERGLFLKGAAGVSSLFNGAGPQPERSNGLGMLVSAGYALRVYGPHHLMLSAEQGWQTYWGSSATKPESSRYNAAYVGYLWMP